MAKSKFQHLPLPSLRTGPARFGRPPLPTDTTRANRENYADHATTIGGQIEGAVEKIRHRLESRGTDAPKIEAGVPLVLEVDPSFFDLDLLRHHFDFEVVLEDDEGFVIVASEDLNFTKFRAMVEAYADDAYGSATIASIHRVDDDGDQIQRLKHILSPRLFAVWPKLSSKHRLFVDVSVECVGTIEVPKPLSDTKQKSDTERTNWQRQKEAAYLAWEDLQESRQAQLERIVEGHEGRVIWSSYPASEGHAELPDCFSTRIEINGDGLRDLVLNFAYIFEVVEPDDIELPQFESADDSDETPPPRIISPAADAPTICVIDSGIQEGHPFISAAIDSENSYSFLPNDDFIGDQVSGGGHGTRVAGVAMFGESIPSDEEFESEFWLQNARVLNSRNGMPRQLFPPKLIGLVVTHFNSGDKQTRIFNHSINATAPCRTRHMSAWPAAIDKLSYDKDVLIIQSAGNVDPRTFKRGNPGVGEHLDAGRRYPDFVYESSFRVSNPAQSFQALTVGSVSYTQFTDPEWASFGSTLAAPSAFSRTGLGIWDVIKPDVVEFGGDYLLSVSGDVSTPEHAEVCYPQTVRSTLEGGPSVAREVAGTSFAAPKVARLAAKLQAILPDEPCLVYRALIAQSARWPGWAYESDDPDQKLRYLRSFGYGIPNEERATSNNVYRSTLISQGEQTIVPGKAKVFQIPVPPEMNKPGDDFDIQVEVTLSYASQPRRTRRGFRGYLSTWLEWKSSGLNEREEDFVGRIFKDEDKNASHKSLPWQLRKKVDAGIEGARRTAGTLQKDWAVIKSNQLPETFCVAVIAHKGWSKDPDTEAKFSLVVSFESITEELRIHERLEVSLGELMIKLQPEIEL